MASKDVVLDVDETSISSAQNDLVFQEIPHTAQGKPEKVQTHIFTNFPHPDDSDSDDKTELLDGDKKSQLSFLSFAYYQSFFDVDTRQVIGRILGSFYPDPRVNYLQTHIRPKPDFYGPFWVSTTLVMSIAIAGNLANYFNSYSSHQDFKWQYDFHKVTIATAAIYTYWLLMPLFVYLFLRWRGNRAVYQFAELVCLYGYSLSIYIPISILCLVPISWLQWSFVLLGMLVSGAVLVFTIWPSVRGEKRQISIFLAVFVTFMHAVLAVGFMLYFFSSSSPVVPDHTATTTAAAVSSATSYPKTVATTTSVKTTTTLGSTTIKPTN